MKKIYFLLALFFSVTAFSQQAASTFNYKAKFESVSTPEKATEVMNVMKTVFKTTSTYNESTGLVEFTSKMSINQSVFNHLMAGEGFPVESFEKQEVKEPVPVTVPATSEPVKQASTTTAAGTKTPGK